MITVTSLRLSIPVSVSVFEFAQIVLQVYRDKNLHFTLDLRTPSLLSLRLSLDLRNPEPFKNPCLSLDLRNPEPFENLCLNLDLRTLSLLNLYVNTSISAL